MRKRLQNITSTINTLAALLVLLAVWQIVCVLGIVPGYMLPSPVQVVSAFVEEFPLLMSHLRVTLTEAFIGLLCGVAVGFVVAVLMDRFEKLYKAVYPLVVLTQTIPTVAIAPLLVLWFGYEMLPKVILIVITTFFPVTVGVLTGLRSADKDTMNLLRSMGAGRMQIFRYVKLPGAMGQFFSQSQDFGRILGCGSGDLRMAGRLQRAGRLYDPCKKSLCL